jgi:hypothetical protein
MALSMGVADDIVFFICTVQHPIYKSPFVEKSNQPYFQMLGVWYSVYGTPNYFNDSIKVRDSKAPART